MNKLIPVLFLIVSYSAIAQNVIGSDTVIVPAVPVDSVSNPSPQKNVIDTQLSNSLHPGKKKFRFDNVHLLLSINYSYYNPFSVEKDIFQGPYYPVPDS